VALSLKTTLQLAHKLRKLRPSDNGDDGSSEMTLWIRVVQAVASSVVMQNHLALFVDAAGYPVKALAALVEASH
jgi:hypothetical protein